MDGFRWTDTRCVPTTSSCCWHRGDKEWSSWIKTNIYHSTFIIQKSVRPKAFAFSQIKFLLKLEGILIVFGLIDKADSIILWKSNSATRPTLVRFLRWSTKHFLVLQDSFEEVERNFQVRFRPVGFCLKRFQSNDFSLMSLRLRIALQCDRAPLSANTWKQLLIGLRCHILEPHPQVRERWKFIFFKV